MPDDSDLTELQQQIQCDTAQLHRLREDIEQAASDDESPVDPTCYESQQEPVTAFLTPSPSLATARRRIRSLRRPRQQFNTGLLFDLRSINSLLERHVASGAKEALELPKYTAPQRRQVSRAHVNGLLPCVAGPLQETADRHASAQTPVLPWPDLQLCEVWKFIKDTLSKRASPLPDRSKHWQVCTVWSPALVEGLGRHFSQPQGPLRCPTAPDRRYVGNM